MVKYQALAHLFVDYFLFQKVEPLPAAQEKVQVHVHACDLLCVLLAIALQGMEMRMW